jgi:GH24 family phage-related lysozyme (muramidase)
MNPPAKIPFVGPPKPEPPILVRPKATLAQAEARLRAERVPIDETYALIRKYEGFRAKPYKDSEGNWTIGVGTKIGAGTDKDLAASGYKGKEITEEEAAKIARKDIKAKAELAAGKDQLGEVFHTFTPQTLAHVVSGYYRGDLSGSPNTKALLLQGKFDEAAKEFLDSDEYRAAKKAGSGVKARMDDLAAALKAEAARRKPESFGAAVERRMKNTK